MLPTAPPANPIRTLPLRWHLVILVVGTLLPLVLFSAVIVSRLATEQRKAALRRLSHSSMLMEGAVEREFSSTIRTLEALAESDRLDQQDLRGFWRDARRVHRTQPTWLAIQLAAPDGRQLFTTALPYGTPLPPVSEPESLREVVRSNAPAIGTLVRSALYQRWMFPIRVPVRRLGKIRFVLSAAITPQALTDAVVRQLPASEEWTRTVLDSNHVVVARTRDPERYIGENATPGLHSRLESSNEGIYLNTALDGVRVYAAYFRNRETHWSTVVSATAKAVDGPVMASIAAVSGTGLALLLLSGAGAYILSRRVSHGIGAAAKAARSLAHGEQPQMLPSSVRELAQLSAALNSSSQLLSQRAAERDRHLGQAEAARAEAEAANRVKDEFLAMLGHELRNPLSPIITALHILRIRGQADLREWKIIDRQARHLANLLNDLLDVSRITRGKIDLEREPVELATIFARAVEMVSPLISEKRHELALSVPESGLQVEGDPLRLTQIVSNLLTNAAKYTPPSGRIDLTAQRAGEWVEISVRDNGAGMAAELLSRVFEAFVQGPRSPDRQEGGLGVGLAIVQNMVRLHGGSVSAASDGPGCGSTFTVRLPAHSAAETSGRDDSDPDCSSV